MSNFKMSLKNFVMGGCDNCEYEQSHTNDGMRQRLSVVTFNLVQLINTGHISDK